MASRNRQPRKPRWRGPMNERIRRQIKERVIRERLNPANKDMKAVAKAAGTSARTAYRICADPATQNVIARALEEAGLTPAQLVQPLVDGLQACVVVKSGELLTAKKTTVPDLEMRGRTFDRIVETCALGAPRDVGREAPGLPVNVQINVMPVAPSRPQEPAPTLEVRGVAARPR